jgi:hypothetical protein
MNLTQEQREQVSAEVKRFATDLHLSDDQKTKLQNAFTDARSRVGDYLKEHPGTTGVPGLFCTSSNERDWDKKERALHWNRCIRRLTSCRWLSP